MADGKSYRDIKESLGTTAPTISLWKKRYQQEGVIGLGTVRPGQPPQKLTPALRAKILSKTQLAPPDGSTHWSLRKMAAVIGVGKELIRKVWKEADLKPHRLERYMASNDPAFEERRHPSSVSTSTRRSMRRCSALTRRARFRRSIGWIAAFRYRPAVPSGTDLNTSGTVRCPCSPH